MDISIVIQGIIVGLILAVPVGPLSLICIQRTLSRGRLHGILSGIGITIADSIYAAVAFLGLSVIAGFIIGQESALRILAGLVLVAVGLKIIFFVPDSKQAGNGNESYAKDLLSMTALAIANPMTLIFLMITLPGYGVIFGGSSLVAAAAFVAGFFCGSTIWWIVLCSSLGSVRSRLGTRTLTFINHVSGLFITGMGIVMIAAPVLSLVGITGP